MLAVFIYTYIIDLMKPPEAKLDHGPLTLASLKLLGMNVVDLLMGIHTYKI